MIHFLLISLAVISALFLLSLIFTVIPFSDDIFPIALVITITLLFLIAAILITIGVMLLTNPQSVYVSIRWIWILFGGLGATALLVVAGMILVRGDIASICGVLLVILGIALFVMMVLGIKLAPRTTYEIAIADDINLLRNLPSPSGKTYYFSVVDDIDFEGFEFEESYGIPDSYVIIEGNGYTWFNIEYEVTLDHSYTTFLDLCTYASVTNHSKIQDLSIVNSSFSIIPNNYSEAKHEGVGVDFEILAPGIKLKNVTIDVIVFCAEAEENIRSVSPSYVDKISPSSGYDDEHNIDINITIVD